MKISEAIFVRGAVDPDGYPKDGYKEIAFIGRSNVGKSSLLNSLLSQKKISSYQQYTRTNTTIKLFFS